MCCRAGSHTAVVLFASLVLSGTGCATAGQSWRAGPMGIRAEQGLRVQMSNGSYGSAFAAMKDKQVAPADALLRHMYKGVIALHAGELETGARSMDRAWQIAYQRWTKRVGDAALSMITSDAALPYDPGPAERMFIPYYGGLTWLARNERSAAAVEARRLSTLLASDRGPQPPAEFRGVMRYVAGVMYEMAGERNDADVSFRNAHQLMGDAVSLPGDTLPPDAGHGDVVILIEDGFVGRPEPQSMTFWFDDHELAALSSKSYDVRHRSVHTMESRRRSDPSLIDRSLYRSVTIAWPSFTRHDPPFAHYVGDSWQDESVGPFGDAYHYAADPRILGARAVVGDSSVFLATTISTDVTTAVQADFEREQPGRLARAIARAALREAAFNAAGKQFGDAVSNDDDDDDDDDKKGKGWKTAGKILLGLGFLAAGTSSALLDQPDLRAWQLLPASVTVARLRLPVGENTIEVTRGSEVVSLGTVTVLPGSVTMLTHRWWPNAPRSAVALVEHGSELAHDVTGATDVVNPGDGAPRLPVFRLGVITH